jgi:hypothetical protein
MAVSRIPRFELHIRPLMREMDRRHMMFSFDLWDRDQVFANRDLILNRLMAIDCMPPLDFGGPWPEEFIAIFKRWSAAGGPMLERGRGQYVANRVPAGIRIRGSMTIPGDGYRVWMQEAPSHAGQRSIDVYAEPPIPPPNPNPVVTAIEDIFEIPTNVTFVRIVDADGPHDVTIS